MNLLLSHHKSMLIAVLLAAEARRVGSLAMSDAGASNDVQAAAGLVTVLEKTLETEPQAGEPRTPAEQVDRAQMACTILGGDVTRSGLRATKIAHVHRALLLADTARALVDAPGTDTANHVEKADAPSAPSLPSEDGFEGIDG